MALMLRMPARTSLLSSRLNVTLRIHSPKLVSPPPSGIDYSARFQQGIKRARSINTLGSSTSASNPSTSLSSASASEPGRLVVFITGCSNNGIGNALCRQAAQRGCTVVAAGIEDMSSLQGIAASRLHLDVTDRSSIQSAVDQAILEHGRIDVLVNNAGCAALGSVLEVSMRTLRDIYDVNLFGAIQVTQVVAPHMLGRRSGRIVNMGSIAAWSNMPFSSPYSSSKAALEAISSSLRQELGPLGLQVLHVAPGFIQTNIVDKSKGPRAYDGKLYSSTDSRVTQRLYEFLVDSTSQPGAMPLERFAAALADVALLPPGSTAMPHMFSVGQYSQLILLSKQWMPYWVMDSFNHYLTGLDAWGREPGPLDWVRRLLYSFVWKQKE